MKNDDTHQNIDQETIVVTTEQGIVLTGSRAEAFEARVIQSVRRPFYAVGSIQFIFFILMVGGGIFLSDLSDTVHNIDDSVVNLKSTVDNTDRIVQDVTSPEAQAKQEEVIKNLLSEMNCQDQRNLQKLVEEIADAGISLLENTENIVEPQCQIKEVE